LSAPALDQRSEIERRIKEMNAQIQSKAKETLAQNNQKQPFFLTLLNSLSAVSNRRDMLQGVKASNVSVSRAKHVQAILEIALSR
jgi:hypothetical protein